MGIQELRGSIVDALLQAHPGLDHTPSPVPVEALREPASRAAADGTSLIGYMFKQAPDERHQLASDPAKTVAEMDSWGIDAGLVVIEPEGERETIEALLAQGRRLYVGIRANPHGGMAEVRRIEALAKEYDIIKAISLSPMAIYPFITPNSKEYYPIYAKAVELDLPVYLNVGMPGPRVPGDYQNPIHLDEVCWFFPDLTVVMRHGGEPWVDLCVKMLLKWPNLYYATSAFAPRHYPKAIIDFANTRGSEKIMYAGYWPTLSFERLFKELGELPLRDEVWPKFLSENARRVFKLDKPSTS
jgi:predicted TIM-barrel fold metal-dependent hydrolase